MSIPRNKYYILNYVFLICLLILLSNEHYFKNEYSNWLTGKLSDISGIILLPLLLVYLFPLLKYMSIVISAILFAFWKSLLSQGLIDLYNESAFIQTSRIVDYTDLVVLIFLPVPYLIIKKIDHLKSIKIKKIHPLMILFPTFFILMSTSPPLSYYITQSEGNLKCYNCRFTVPYKQTEIVEKLKNLQLRI